MIKRIKLKDVAAKAGVAVNTASTILNRRPNSWASKSTEEKVFAAAAELGYKPNKTARALRSGKFLSLGFLVQDMTNPFFSTLADAIEVEAGGRGYDLLIENCRSSVERERHLFSELDDLKVDGVILWLSDNEKYRSDLAALQSSGLKIIALGNDTSTDPLPVDSLISDFQEGITDAAKELVAKGHKSFVFLSAIAEGQSYGNRSDIFIQALAANGVDKDAVKILHCGHTPEDSYQAYTEFLKNTAKEKLPTALVAMNDTSAVAAMKAAQNQGLHVPQDFSVVGVDDIPLCAYLPVTLSSIRQRYKMIAKSAVDMLIERIDATDEIPARVQHFATVFVPRDSIANSSV